MKRKLVAGAIRQAAVEHPGNRQPMILGIGGVPLAGLSGKVHRGLCRSQPMDGEMAQGIFQQGIEARGLGQVIAIVVRRPRQRRRNQPASRCAPAKTAGRVIGGGKSDRHMARGFPSLGPRCKRRGRSASFTQRPAKAWYGNRVSRALTLFFGQRQAAGERASVSHGTGCARLRFPLPGTRIFSLHRACSSRWFGGVCGGTCHDR